METKMTWITCELNKDNIIYVREQKASQGQEEESRLQYCKGKHFTSALVMRILERTLHKTNLHTIGCALLPVSR